MGTQESTQSRIPVKEPPVGFDIEQFSGKWYGIARSKDAPEMCGNNSMIEVIKHTTHYTIEWSCYTNTKLTSVKRANIEMPNDNEMSKLILSFRTPSSCSTIDFWIYQTDYVNYAIVGGPDGYVWIYSREPHIAESTYDKLIKLGREQRLNVDNIVVDRAVIYVG